MQDNIIGSNRMGLWYHVANPGPTLLVMSEIHLVVSSSDVGYTQRVDVLLQ